MYTLQDSAPFGLSLFDFPAPAGRVISGAFDEALETNPVPLFMLSMELNASRSAGPLLSRDNALEEAKRAGVKVKIGEDGISQSALGILIERRRDQAARELLYSRREGVLPTIGMFGAGLAGALMDPVNAAAGYIPVLSGTRYAGMLEKAATAGSRAALRGGIGAAEGAVGAGIVEVPTLAMRRELQDEYGLYDSLANIAFGTFASSGLRMVGGAARDRWRGLQAARQEDFLRSVEPEQWAAARMAYERQLERGMFEDLEGGFARGTGPADELAAKWAAQRSAQERLLGTDEDIARMQRRMSDPEVARFLEAEQKMRSEAAAPDDRMLLDAAGVAERKFREMDLAEVKERLERGEGLIIVPGNEREVAAAISDETHAQALKVAVAQAIEGRRIDVDPVVRQDPVFGPQRMGQDEVRKRAQSNMAPESKVGADAAASRRAAETIKGTEAPAANRGGRAEPPPPRGDVASGEAAGAEAINAAAAKLELSRLLADEERLKSARLRLSQEKQRHREGTPEFANVLRAEEKVADELGEIEAAIHNIRNATIPENKSGAGAPSQREPSSTPLPKSPELVEAEALLARTKDEVQRAANDAGIELVLPEVAGIKQSEDYARAWRAIAACATGKGL